MISGWRWHATRDLLELLHTSDVFTVKAHNHCLYCTRHIRPFKHVQALYSFPLLYFFHANKTIFKYCICYLALPLLFVLFDQWDRYWWALPFLIFNSSSTLTRRSMKAYWDNSIPSLTDRNIYRDLNTIVDHVLWSSGNSTAPMIIFNQYIFWKILSSGSGHWIIE